VQQKSVQMDIMNPGEILHHSHNFCCPVDASAFVVALIFLTWQNIHSANSLFLRCATWAR